MSNRACLVHRRRSDPVAPEVLALSPWFHNLHLPDATQTAPRHPLGDFPACKWARIRPHLPRDLTGWTVLDIGCNAGFYSIELALRGARVTAIDCEPHFLRQAAWAIAQHGLERRVALHQMQVYELARVAGAWDLVVFMGVFYHLRHPLLALDMVAEKTRRLMLFQTLTMPGSKIHPVAADYDIEQRAVMQKAGWPKMAFIEKSIAGDESNWWAPNHAAVGALLRSAGMKHIQRITHEIYLCRPSPRKRKLSVTRELEAAVGRPAFEKIGVMASLRRRHGDQHAPRAAVRRGHQNPKPAYGPRDFSRQRS